MSNEEVDIFRTIPDLRPRARSHLHSARPCPPTSPSVPSIPTRTCVGALPCWQPMCQYMVRITPIQIDMTFIIPKLIDGLPSHAKGA
jgi:hypothetical protein